MAAYSAVKGEAIAAAALEVNTMQPRCFFCTCEHVPGASQRPPDYTVSVPGFVDAEKVDLETCSHALLATQRQVDTG